MATLVEDAMESYVYPSYNPYSYRYQPPKGKGGPGPWRQRGGYFSGYGETAAVAAAAAEYFDNYQRAQLKAILSQVNPNLTPRLRKANTKEVGVQVNPRQDVSVQCSLGPRPLLLRRRTANVEQEQGSPVTGSSRPVRFPRTIAVYSPVASRRLTTFLEEPEPQTLTASPRPPPASSQPPEVDEGAVGAVGASWKNPEESPAEAQERRQPQKEEAAEGKEASQGGEERPAKSREATEKEEALPEEKREAEGELQAAEKPASQQQARKEAGQIPRAEVWLLPLQGLQHPLGECLCVVCARHKQELQADKVHLPCEIAPCRSQETPSSGSLRKMQRQTSLL
ncbi:zygote arrest protein 1 isoform X4 [Rhineura floridana]|uniref:zygote arrest protein 1 isoform X4 n=1 Tax=Rhineura floridana TaxID=261503 RepID=UPI002AC7E8CB|nr:zygote arrest protein 1 isoform X4 [Rhineura floridana]